MTTLGAGSEVLPGPRDGHLHLHQDDVGLAETCQLDGTFVVVRLPYDLHAAVVGQDPRDALAKHGVVIRQEHPDRIGFASSLHTPVPGYAPSGEAR